MPRLILFFCAFLFSITISAQNKSQSLNIVKDYFDNSAQQSVIYSSIGNDSIYYFVGRVSTTSHLFNVGILKTNSEGDKLASMIFQHDSIPYIPAYHEGAIIFDSDSNLVVVGSYIHGKWGGFVAKLDQDLNVIWHNRYRLPKHIVNNACDTPSFEFDVIKLDLNGDYIIAGSYFKDCINYSVNKRTFLMKLDSLGNVKWIKRYQSFGMIGDLDVLHDSAYLISETFLKNWRIHKLDFNGNILWTKDVDNGYDHNPHSSIAISSDSTIISMSAHILAISTYTLHLGINVIKLDLNTQTILWDKKYEVFNNLVNGLLPIQYDLIYLQNDRILAVGSTEVWENFVQGDKGFMCLMDSQGDTIWMKRYYAIGPTENCNFNNGFITPSGYFVASGYYNKQYTAKFYPWIFRTDSTGIAPGSGLGLDAGQVTPNDLAISMYPNPANDELSINSNDYTIEDVTIFNVNGKEIFEIDNIRNNSIGIKVSSFPTGIYFVKIRLDEGQTVFDKLIIKK